MSTGSVGHTSGHNQPGQVRASQDTAQSAPVKGKVKIVGKYAPAMAGNARMGRLAEALIHRPRTGSDNKNPQAVLNPKALLLPERLAVSGMPELLSKQGIESLNLGVRNRKDMALQQQLEKLDQLLKSDDATQFYAKSKKDQSKFLNKLTSELKKCDKAVDAANLTANKKANLHAHLADQADVVDTIAFVIKQSGKNVDLHDQPDLPLLDDLENFLTRTAIQAEGYTKMNFEDRTASLKKMTDELSKYKNKLSDHLESAAGKKLSTLERKQVKNLIAAAEMRLNAVAALAHDEMRTNAKTRDLVERTLGPSLTKLTQPTITRPDTSQTPPLTKTIQNRCAAKALPILRASIIDMGGEWELPEDQVVSGFLRTLTTTSRQEAMDQISEVSTHLNRLYEPIVLPGTPETNADAQAMNDALDEFKRALNSIAEEFQSGPDTVSLDDLIAARMYGHDLTETLTATAVHLPVEETARLDFDDIFRSGTVQPIGNGSVSTVFKATWAGQDGIERTRVVKVDVPATKGLKDTRITSAIALGTDDGYGAINRNLACGYAAEALGMSDILPKPDAIVMDGKLAIAMPVATGRSPTGMSLETSKNIEHANATHLSKQEILEDYDLSASLAKELCRLEWLDCVTGQGDRNPQNYLVDIVIQEDIDSYGNPVTIKQAKVTAIDNDISFGKNNTLVGQVKDEKNTVVNFNKWYDKEEDPGADTVTPFEMRRYYNFEEGFLIGKGKFANIHSGRLPALIDKSTFDALVGNASSPRPAAEILGKSGSLLSEQAYKAAVSRVENLQQHAILLEQMGLMVEDWTDWRCDGIVSPTSLSHFQTFKVGAGSTPLQYLLNCGADSYFARDFADPLARKQTLPQGLSYPVNKPVTIETVDG